MHTILLWVHYADKTWGNSLRPSEIYPLMPSYGHTKLCQIIQTYKKNFASATQPLNFQSFPQNIQHKLTIKANTGWSIMTVKEYKLSAQAKKHPLSLDTCPFHHYIGTFWYLVSKRFHDQPVIIHLERLLRCETVKYGKQD